MSFRMARIGRCNLARVERTNLFRTTRVQSVQSSRRQGNSPGELDDEEATPANGRTNGVLSGFENFQHGSSATWGAMKGSHQHEACLPGLHERCRFGEIG